MCRGRIILTDHFIFWHKINHLTTNVADDADGSSSIETLVKA